MGNAIKLKNVLLLIDFENMLRDDALDEVFYPESDRIGRFPFSLSNHHPLHPEFVSPEPGLLAEAPTYDRAGLGEMQRHRIAEHWKAVRNNDVYRSLDADTNFQNAREAFINFSQKRAGLYKHAYAEFRFVKIAVWHVGTFLASPGRTVPSPSSKDKQAAIGHIEALLSDIEERGVRFAESYLRDLQLIKTLEALKQELVTSGRRPRHDEAKPFRDFNMALARALIRAFGEASPVIVQHLARAAGCDLDERTIDSHIEAARNREISD